MAHARLKFTDAQKASPSKKVGKPEKALNFIAYPKRVQRVARCAKCFTERLVR